LKAALATPAWAQAPALPSSPQTITPMTNISTTVRLCSQKPTRSIFSTIGLIQLKRGCVTECVSSSAR
jgi:hypothetical protein